MADPVITNNDTGLVTIGGDHTKQDDTYTAAGAGTLAAGTILARDSVSGKLVLFVKGGSTNENGIPKAVIDYDVVIAGAGDVYVQPITRGDVRFDKLIIAADGDNSNVDQAVRDQLRDYTILVRDVDEMNILDNQ